MLTIILMNDLNGNLVIRLLLDTQILIWLPAADKRLKVHVRDVILDETTELFVSAITAWEYTDLRKRKRVAAPETIAELQLGLGFTLLDLPAKIWSDIDGLPVIHRDPVDRMLICHARHADIILATADKAIRQYPIKTLW